MISLQMRNLFALNTLSLSTSLQARGHQQQICMNLKYEVVNKPNSSAYEDFVNLYITESAWDSLQNMDELFIAYGKQYWLYRPFWDSLSASDKVEAAKLNGINELIDPQSDVI